MKFVHSLGVDRRGRTWLQADPGESLQEVVGVAAACRRLRKSRRQVYRYIRSGTLRPRVKFLGEWLVSAGDVERLARAPLARRRIPRRLQLLFPEYAVSALHAARDRALILSRVLERGDRTQIRWAFDRYSTRDIAEFLNEEGPRLLTPRTVGFWKLYFRVRRPAPRTSPVLDRALGRKLGGTE